MYSCAPRQELTAAANNAGHGAELLVHGNLPTGCPGGMNLWLWRHSRAAPSQARQPCDKFSARTGKLAVSRVHTSADSQPHAQHAQHGATIPAGEGPGRASRIPSASASSCESRSVRGAPGTPAPAAPSSSARLASVCRRCSGSTRTAPRFASPSASACARRKPCPLSCPSRSLLAAAGSRSS
jgi:hypothetical protein